MTKKERVGAAFAHQEPDRVPKGELSIQAGIANRLLAATYPDDYQHYERDRRVRELLHIDYVNMGEWPARYLGTDDRGYHHYLSAYGDEYAVTGASRHVVKPLVASLDDARSYRTPDLGQVTGELIRRFCADSDLFVFGQIAGPVTALDEALGMEEFLVGAMTNTTEMAILAEAIMTFEIGKAKIFLDAGADAIIIGDDIAFNSGPFLPPRIMAEIAFPFYRQAIAEIRRRRRVPVILHSDGNLMPVMDEILSCGFVGLHSLQPSAGMDIGEVKRRYGSALTLMGNIDLDYVMTAAPAREVAEVVKRTIDIAAPGGGYILSTCNALIDAIPDDNALAMYRTADSYRTSGYGR